MNYRVTPIPAEVASAVRETLLSPQYKSLTAIVSLANGYGPCRSCLRVFDQGTDYRIYFTYNSFDGRSSLPDPGPVFVHQNECTRFTGEGIPDDLLQLPVLLEAFGEVDPPKILEQGKRDGVIECHAQVCSGHHRPKAVHPTRCREL